MLTVRIQKTSGNYETIDINVRKNTITKIMVNDIFSNSFDDELIDYAIKKHYGKNCFFHRNNSVSYKYGQVFKNLKNQNFSTSVTGNISIDII